MKWINQLLLLLGILSFIPVSNAVECGQESPSFIALQDDYWNNNNALVVAGDEEALEWLQSLKGSWIGSMSFTECLGSGNNQRKVTKTFGLENVKVMENSELLFFARMVKRDEEERSSHSEKLELMLKSDLYALQVSQNDLSANERRRKRFIADPPRTLGGSVYQEKFIEMSLVEDVLTINVTTYFNTVFAYSEKISLRRD